MVQYGRAIKRPFTDIKKLIIGFLLNIIPIVNFLVLGYQLECAKTAMKKNFSLPDWENWGELFVRGLLMFVLSIIYFIPFVIVLLIFGVSLLSAFTASALTESTTGLLASLSGAVGGSIALVIIGIITIYILPLAILGYVEKWNFGDSFNFGKILKKALTGQYFIAWFLVLLYGLIISTILAAVPFIGGALAGYIIGVTWFTVLGELYPSL